MGEKFSQIGDRHPGSPVPAYSGLLLIAAFKLGLTGVVCLPVGKHK